MAPYGRECAGYVRGRGDGRHNDVAVARGVLLKAVEISGGGDLRVRP